MSRKMSLYAVLWKENRKGEWKLLRKYGGDYIVAPPTRREALAQAKFQQRLSVMHDFCVKRFDLGEFMA